MTSTATLSVADRIALTLGGLCRAVAARIAGGAIAAAMITLIWGRVRRAERQVLGLLARFRAGRLRVGTGAARRGGAGGTRGTGAPGLPRRFGWLLPMVPCEAANFASQLRVVLDDSEMQALLAAAPQARRVLGPVCRMLGIALAGTPDPSVREGAEARPAPVKAKRVRPGSGEPPWRIPLPRGVLTAARRQGFGRVPDG